MFLGLFLAAALAPSASVQSSKPGKQAGQQGKAAASAAASPVLLETMQQELNRAMAALGKSDPAPYFISYSAREQFAHVIAASRGALLTQHRPA